MPSLNENTSGIELGLSLVPASGCQLTLSHQSTLQKRTGAGTLLLPSSSGDTRRPGGKPSSSGCGVAPGAQCPSPTKLALLSPKALHPGAAAGLGREMPSAAGTSHKATQRASCRGAQRSWPRWTVSYCRPLSPAAGGGVLGCSFLPSQATQYLPAQMNKVTSPVAAQMRRLSPRVLVVVVVFFFCPPFFLHYVCNFVLLFPIGKP